MGFFIELFHDFTCNIFSTVTPFWVGLKWIAVACIVLIGTGGSK